MNSISNLFRDFCAFAIAGDTPVTHHEDLHCAQFAQNSSLVTLVSSSAAASSSLSPPSNDRATDSRAAAYSSSSRHLNSIDSDSDDVFCVKPARNLDRERETINIDDDSLPVRTPSADSGRAVVSSSNDSFSCPICSKMFHRSNNTQQNFHIDACLKLQSASTPSNAILGKRKQFALFRHVVELQ